MHLRVHVCVLNKNVRLVYMYIHGNSHVTWDTYVCMYIANVHSVGGVGSSALYIAPHTCTEVVITHRGCNYESVTLTSMMNLLIRRCGGS